MGITSSSLERKKYHLRDVNNTKLCLMSASDMINGSVSFGPCPQGFSVLKETDGKRAWEGGDTMKEWESVVGKGKRGPCPDGWKQLANGQCYSPEKYEGPCPRLGYFDGLNEKEKQQWAISCKNSWTPFTGEKIRNVENGYCVGVNDENIAILTNCGKQSSTWKQKKLSNNNVKLVNPATNKCLIAKTYEAAQLGNCNLPTAEMEKVTTSVQTGTKTQFGFFNSNREFTNFHSDDLTEIDTGAASRSGICYQNPSLMTKNDLKDSINFCQRFQNAQTQEERANIMREFQITLKGEGGRDGWIPSARNCNDFCYNLATYQSRTNQGPKYLEKAWEKPWNWTACDFDYVGKCQSFKDGSNGDGKLSNNGHVYGSPSGCSLNYFEDLCRASGPPKSRKGQSTRYTIKNPSQNVWGVKKYHNVCVPGRRRAECEKGWYNQVQLRDYSTKCSDTSYLTKKLSNGLTGADSMCTNAYGKKWIAGIPNNPNSRDYLYNGGCQNGKQRAQCRQLRSGETKQCVGNSFAESEVFSYGGHNNGDIICQNKNTIHYPAQNRPQIQGGTVPSINVPMGEIYGMASKERTSCPSGNSRLLCQKSYQGGYKVPYYSTPCTRHQNAGNYRTATDIGWSGSSHNYNGWCQKFYGWPFYAGYKSDVAGKDDDYSKDYYNDNVPASAQANWDNYDGGTESNGCPNRNNALYSTGRHARVKCIRANPNIESIKSGSEGYPRPEGEGQHWDARIAYYNGSGKRTKYECLGSSTKISVIRGMSLPKKMKLSELLPGDKVMVYDMKNQTFYWDVIYYIRSHGNNTVKHISITTESDDEIIGTVEHLIYVDTDEGFKRVRFDNITKDMSLLRLNKSTNLLEPVKIKEIKEVDDIPLTPTTTSGILTLGDNNILTSCWAHSEEHAQRMEFWSKSSQLLTKVLPYKLCSKIAHFSYENIISPIVH